jgi:hypothetical protein
LTRLSKEQTDGCMTGGGINMPADEAIVKCITEQCIPEPNSGCLLWLGSVMGTGYGRVRIERKTYLVHRVMFEAIHGPIPDGLFVCHKCDTPSCVNPAHLFTGTNAENMADMIRKLRSPRGTSRSNSKLTDSDVRKIRELSARGVLQKAIASKYGVARVVIQKAISRKTWSHVQ